MFFPPYSPELNPLERLWDYLKENFLNIKLFINLAALKNEVYDALKLALNKEKEVKSICGYMSII